MGDVFRYLVLGLLAFLSVVPEAQGQEDTLQAVRSVDRALRNRYSGGQRPGSGGTRRQVRGVDAYCDGGSGAVCHGGDPDRGYCPRNVPCHPTEEFFLNALLEAVEEAPTSGYVLGQAVYALTKYGYVEEATQVVDSCRAESWWCQALRGYVLVWAGSWGAAEPLFRSAMGQAPADARCDFLDATWLLGEWDQRRGEVNLLPEARRQTEDWTCSRRVSVSDSILWLADPFFHDEGNDRWTEHVARALSAQFSTQILRAVRGGDLPRRYRDYEWAMEVRRGSWDSFELPPGNGVPRFWTSNEKALYSYVPLFESWDLSTPSWDIDGDLRREGFTPETVPVHQVGVQIARFREGDSLLVVSSAGLMDSPLRRATRATGHLILSDGPGSYPLRLTEEVRRTDPVFLGVAEGGKYVVGIEVVADIGIGWDRRVVSSLSQTGPELSDLLLYRPGDSTGVESVREASRTMFSSRSVERGSGLGVFWETYGAPSGEELEIELSLERSSGGLVNRLAALLSGGRQEGRGQVAWTEPASGEVHRRSVALDLSELERGEYTLVLRVQWAGQAPMRRIATLSIGP